MQTFGDLSFKNASRADHRANEGLSFMHPDDVVGALHLTQAEKREILASWASDVRAVPNAPALRQLDNGSVIHIDDVLTALRSLDDDVHQSWALDLFGFSDRARRGRASRRATAIWRRIHSKDDDDDPPPCPAMIAAPPRKPLLSGEAIDPSMAYAA